MVTESVPSWIRQASDEALVHVNVGGLRRSLCSSTLKKFPDTRLGKLLACESEEAILQVCDDYDVQQKEFYFDRNPGLFRYVLHFYQTGKLHIMEELCIFSFSQEIEYWGINEFFLDSCCSYRYHDRKLESARRRSWDDESDASSIDTSVDEISDLNKDMQHFQEVRFGNVRKCLWLTLENPGYSIPSKLFSLVSISVVLTSIATMCINSIPEYQTFDDDGKLVEDWTTQVLEVFCSCWFTFEVATRLLLAPNRSKFFHHPLNIIDVASVIPIYITLTFDLTVGAESDLGDLGRLIQVFRLMRIFRVLKLARHSTGLRSLGATLRHSYREVGILLLYLAVGVSVFSGFAYTAEYEEDVGLDTIPACWWWGTVSMTTVGYGDVVPVTVAGKLAASGCILGGTLVVALPITIIFNKFSHFYRRQKALEASVRNSSRGPSRPGGRDGAGAGDGDEDGDGDGRCLDRDRVQHGGQGGVINYSFVEHASSSSTPAAPGRHSTSSWKMAG
ncbi:potassium voltage-gated channel subfamily S member 2 [Takifugu rubripes]|uniref:Delayed-rectifier potassium channel regulatory subunit KCNS1 n=1 Tax=Takifugu rubripes TaxID=31033 RepID=A0A674MNC9_TAKRU|nr:potassium voltage-gated channel subfamily S member 2-like [Takifugu rubripes]XP_029682144.1 potassium voltage-gated channel subfamily S member 2-like [Takifugu rubripes]